MRSANFRGVIDPLNNLGYNVEAGVTENCDFYSDGNPDVRFLLDLQKCHDSTWGVENMKEWLVGFAQKYNLSTEVLSP